jgi:hypothetical protein
MADDAHHRIPGVAAVKTALALGPGHRIVTVLCDSGTKHLSKFWAKAGNVGVRKTQSSRMYLMPEKWSYNALQSANSILRSM